jgi:hypothetical protein
VLHNHLQRHQLRDQETEGTQRGQQLRPVGINYPLAIQGQAFTPRLVNQVRPRVYALGDRLLDRARGPDGPAWCCVS